MGFFESLRRVLAGAHEPLEDEPRSWPKPPEAPASPAEQAELPDIPDSLAQLPRRTAWLPVSEAGEGPAAGSRVGGRPFLMRGERWPCCPRCEQPLHLVVQLRSSDLPPEWAERTGPGIFRLLYCLSECEVDGEGWEPGSEVHHVARLPLDAEGEMPGDGRALPAFRFTGWEPIDDLPHQEDMDRPLSPARRDDYYGSRRPLSGDKLGGWPMWVQGPERPSCPDCREPMTVLFQVDSHGHLDFMWGDTGCAHLSFCEQHPHRLAFGWACC